MAQHADVPLEMVTEIGSVCLDLPEAYEEPAWVGTRWRIRGRTFAHVLTVDSGWPPAYARAAAITGPATLLMFRSSGPELEVLRGSGHPFFGPPWRADEVGLVLAADVDWNEVAELVTESYCVTGAKEPGPRRSTDRSTDRNGIGRRSCDPSPDVVPDVAPVRVDIVLAHRRVGALPPMVGVAPVQGCADRGSTRFSPCLDRRDGSCASPGDAAPSRGMTTSGGHCRLSVQVWFPGPVAPAASVPAATSSASAVPGVARCWPRARGPGSLDAGDSSSPSPFMSGVASVELPSSRRTSSSRARFLRSLAWPAGSSSVSTSWR